MKKPLNSPEVEEAPRKRKKSEGMTYTVPQTTDGATARHSVQGARACLSKEQFASVPPDEENIAEYSMSDD